MNDTILRDVDLAELVSESFSRVADDLPPFAFNPIPVSDVPDEYIISPEAVELVIPYSNLFMINYANSVRASPSDQRRVSRAQKTYDERF